MNYKKFPSTVETSPSKNKINYTLAVLTTRKIDNGNFIKFKNKYYQPYDSNHNLVCFKPHTECLVIEAFDGSIMVTIDVAVYQLKELQKHKQFSTELDEPQIIPKKKKVYIPPMSHPWKASSFKKQLEKAHTNHVYA